MRYEELLADRLRAVDFDLSRLSDAELAEVNRLARAARVELPHPGVIWASHRDAERYGHVISHVDARRP